MFDALSLRLAEDYDVVQIDNRELRFAAGEDDVHITLKGSRCIAKFKEHSDESV